MTFIVAPGGRSNPLPEKIPSFWEGAIWSSPSRGHWRAIEEGSAALKKKATGTGTVPPGIWWWTFLSRLTPMPNLPYGFLFERTQPYHTMLWPIADSRARTGPLLHWLDTSYATMSGLKPFRACVVLGASCCLSAHTAQPGVLAPILAGSSPYTPVHLPGLWLL